MPAHGRALKGGTLQAAEKGPKGVILRSRRRRRISQVIDSLQGEILRFAQNDIAEDFFSNLLRVGQLGPLRGDNLVNLQDGIGVKLGLVGRIGMVVSNSPKFARLGDAAGQDGAAGGDVHVGL